MDMAMLYGPNFVPSCSVDMDRLLPEAKYASPLLNMSVLPLLLYTLAIQQKHAPRTTPLFYDEYDYIIVGAGAGGSVVASRLSEVSCVKVLLLEAGKSPPFLTEVPALARFFVDTDIDWKYQTAPQTFTGDGLKNRKLAWPSGKVIGGSTIWNAMLYVRGHRQNYDNWAKEGASGWSYKDVLPYFKKMEGNREPDFVDLPFHGFDGPLTVETPAYESELKEAVNLAAFQKGIPAVDANGRQQKGLFNHQATMRDGQRCSAAKAYLVPVDDRPNLDILPDAFVTKILVENSKATGVQFHHHGQRFIVKARKEVILSAGAINSAQLLMLSGIGPREHLESHEIKVVADLPVGLNLQDHITSIVPYELSDMVRPIFEKLLNPANFLNYVLNRKGPLASTEGVSNMIFDSYPKGSSTDGRPDFQIYFQEGDLALVKEQLNIKEQVFERVFAPYFNKTVVWCLSSILNPKSRGFVKLQSSDPYDPPIIDPKYFQVPEDLQDVVEGMKMCHDIFQSEPLQRLGARSFATLYPGCENLRRDGEEYMKCQARSIVLTLSHQVGTAKMGSPSDPTTVVDPELRVKGIKGLRVVDASVMPTVPSGNTMVPTLMIAEKASDIIKKTIQCSTNDNSDNSFIQQKIII